jgi:hypothetical protein
MAHYTSLERFALILFSQRVTLIIEIVILSLDLTVIHRVRFESSIALEQFSEDISITGFMTAITVFDILTLLFHIIYFFIPDGKKNSRCAAYNLIFLVYLIKEPLILKCFTCFNYSSNAIVIARSNLIFLLIFLFAIAYFLDLFAFENKTNRLESNLFILDICLAFLFTMLISAVVVINIILLLKTNESTDKAVGPNNIQIGFFNRKEVTAILDGTYPKNTDLNRRLIGNLSDIIFNKNKVYASKTCSYSGKSVSCAYYYWHHFKYEIMCTIENKQIYTDCLYENAKSLYINAIYLDDGPYPSYNCLINTFNQSCASNCSQMIGSNYELTMIQQLNDSVQPAWKGFCNCGSQPNIILTRNLSINFCLNFGKRLHANSLILIDSFIVYFVAYYVLS